MSFKDLTGFVQQFMNRVASILAEGMELQGAVQNERLNRQKGARLKKLYWAKTWVGYCIFPLEDGRGLSG